MMHPYFFLASLGSFSSQYWKQIARTSAGANWNTSTKGSEFRLIDTSWETCQIISRVQYTQAVKLKAWVCSEGSNRVWKLWHGIVFVTISLNLHVRRSFLDSVFGVSILVGFFNKLCQYLFDKSHKRSYKFQYFVLLQMILKNSGRYLTMSCNCVAGDDDDDDVSSSNTNVPFWYQHCFSVE